MDCEIPGFGDRGDCTMKRPWSLWRKSLEKWGLSNQNKNPAPTTQCLWYGTVTRCHTSSIFQMHQHYAAVSVSWLTSVVTQTAPRRDFNHAFHWRKISIKSSSLHDLQSFTTKRTKWVVLVFFAFFPTLNHTIVTISNVTAWPSRDVAKARGSDFEVNQVRSSCPSADRVLSPWARFSWREVH